MIRHGSIKICSILLWLGMDKIDQCLQIKALDALEKVGDLGAIAHITIAIICNALHNGMLFFVEGNVLVPVSCISLTIIV